MRRLLTSIFIVAALTVVHAAIPSADDFNRADATPLNGNWDNPTANADGDFVIIANVARSTGGTIDSWMVWTGDVYSDEQQSQVELPVQVGGGRYGGVIVRGQASAYTGYTFRANEATSYQMLKYVAGSASVVVTCTGTPTNGDVLRLEVVDSGANAALTGYVNGSSPMGCSYTDSSSPITGGQPGIVGYGGSALDNWTADNMGGSPPQSAPRLLLFGVGE